MARRIVLGIHITNRAEEVPAVQRLLTEFGCNIKTRLGLHEVSDPSCSSKGLLILEMFGDQARASELEAKLKGIAGVEVQKMVFVE